MKKLLILLLLVAGITGSVHAQKTEKTYQLAYLANKEAAVKVAKEQQLNHKSVQIQIFLAEYPVLDSIKNFNKKEKYSLINDALIEAVVVPEHGKYTLYLSKNGLEYKVKTKNKVAKVF